MKKENLERTCYKYEWYLCEYEDNCEYVEKNFTCARHYIDALQKESPDDLELLQKDLHERGHVLMGIEAHLLRLKNSDFEVKKEVMQSVSLRQLLKDDYFVPFVFEYEISGKYHLRSSEFSANCPIARIFSKFKKSIREKYPLDYAARVGLLSHRICNQQLSKYYHNNTLLMIGEKSIPRDKYCERVVQYSNNGIFVRGSCDAVFILKKSNSLAIFDFKRKMKGAKEDKFIAFQLLTYALGVEQMTKRNFDNYFLITAKAPFPPKKDIRAPDYNISLVSKNDQWIDELKREIEESAAIQRMLANSNQHALSYIASKRKTGECFCNKYNKECFSLNLCIDIETELKANEDLLLHDFLDENVNLYLI